MSQDCAGCAAKAETIGLLREMLQRAEDRLDADRARQDQRLVASGPTSETPAPEALPEPVRKQDGEGVWWVEVAGQRVRAEHFDRMAAGEGVVMDGVFSSNAEFAEAQRMLNEQFSGNRLQ